MKNYNNYGEIAIRAIQIYKKENFLRNSWDLATNEFFPDSISSQDKSCPRSAFLGLCEEGLVRGVKSGIYLKNKKPSLNKKYAIVAVKIFSKNTSLSKKELWIEVRKELFLGEKSHNSQMDIVLALGNENYI